MNRRWKAIRDRLIAKLPPWSQLIRGSLVHYYLTCGNPGCRCHRAKRNRHCPYWYVTVSYAAGRQKRYLIPPQKLPMARQGIAAYHRMWKGLDRISELNLALLKSSDKP